MDWFLYDNCLRHESVNRKGERNETRWDSWEELNETGRHSKRDLLFYDKIKLTKKTKNCRKVQILLHIKLLNLHQNKAKANIQKPKLQQQMAPYPP